MSDLHLGTVAERDLARGPEGLERLANALEDAEQVVLLGDLLELRERPIGVLLERARPVLERVGRAAAGKRLIIVPGNHDHHLAGPWLSRARLEPGGLQAESLWPVGPDDGEAGRIGRWMPEVEVVVAYPGLWLRDDVYATHGHYLDLHLTVPRIESVAASLMGRLSGLGQECRSPADYETVLAPLYELMYGLAQGRSGEALLHRGGQVSRTVWRRVDGRSEHRLAGFLLGRVTIPAAVLILNRIGVGPFSPRLNGPELRRSGLRAMAAVVHGLGVEAEHVLFGHTHRAGPMPGDDRSEWIAAGGTRLWNTGSWLHEPVFLDGNPANPYWPGTVVYLSDEGEPELRNVLRDVALPPVRTS